MTDIQLDLPFNIRPLHTIGQVRTILIDNQTKTDLDVDNFLLIPINVVDHQPVVTDKTLIKVHRSDQGGFTRIDVDLTEFGTAQYIVILAGLTNTYRIIMQTDQPIGTRAKHYTQVESFLPTCEWQTYAIPLTCNTNDYALLFSSCQYPGDLFRRVTPKATLVRAKTTLEEESYQNAGAYLLVAGDGVYVDPTAGLFEPKTEHEIFSVAYESQARSVEWQSLLVKMQGTCFAIDDHELIDNWEPSADEETNKELDDRLRVGREWFLRRRYGEEDTGQVLWGEHKLGDIPLFVMDTRTERDLRTPQNHRTAAMASDNQMQALKNWLTAIENKPDFQSVPKIILSPAMILPRTLRTAERTQAVKDLNCSDENEDTVVSLASDSWDGFPQTTGELLGFIAEHQIHNVIFLSGDEHISCIAEAQLSFDGRQPPVTIHSIHASPLYGPYPFANARIDDFANSEAFCQPYLDDSNTANRVHVKVNTTISLAGDAFGLLHIKKSTSDGWHVSVTLSVAGHQDKTLKLSGL